MVLAFNSQNAAAFGYVHQIILSLARLTVHFCIYISVLGEHTRNLFSLAADGLVLIIDYTVSDGCSYPDCKQLWRIGQGV
jgi:hypothetical protein